MSLRRITLACALTAAAAAPLAALAAAPGSGTSEAADDGPTASQLAAVRRATARYRDVQVARRAGYAPAGPCEDSPIGAMGQHYLNPRLAADPRVEARQPEILLYERRGRQLRLIGVEYFRADADGRLDTDEDRPRVLGLAFDGPMEGHTPDMPVHYDLHAWLWKRNPRGTFHQYNPRVHC